jgi:PKD repeat protein
MNKKLKIILLATFSAFAVSTVSTAQVIFEPEGVNLPGQWNSYTNPPATGSVFGNPNQVTNGGFGIITTGTRRYHTTFSTASAGNATSGVNAFLFTSGPVGAPFSNKWTDVTVGLNTIQNYTFHNDGGGSDNSVTLGSYKWYTVNFRDNGYANTQAIFMETSAQPVTITNVTQAPSGNQIMVNTAVTVTVTTSSALSAEEKVYIRYSPDGYAGINNLLPVNMAGTTGTATIPAQAIAGTFISYYVFTTTVSNPTADWDLYTINLGNNNGLNYGYTVINDPVNDAVASNDTTVCSNAFPLTLTATAGYQYAWSTGPLTQSIQVNAPGQYSVQIVNPMTGGFIYDTVNVSVSSPQFSLGSDTSFCGLSSIVLDPGVTLTPDGDSIRIFYNANLGVTGLFGAPKVYMHSGIQFVPFGAVTNYIGNWGQDDGVGEMTSLGNNNWVITIHPANYYGYSQGTAVTAISMVFRNADGTLTGKDDNDNDIFLNINQNPPYSAFSGVTAQVISAEFASIVWNDNSTGTSLPVSTGGTYWARVTDVNGCTASDTVQVTINGLPFVDAGSNQTLCDGETTVLDAGAGFSSYAWSNGATSPSITVSDSGEYTIVVTDNFGCSAQDVIYITEGTSPNADFTFEATGLSVSFTSSNQPAGTSYAWDFTSNGSTDNTTANPSYTFVAPGTYNVSLTITTPCGSDVQTYQLVVTQVGVEELSQDLASIYPNPAKDQVQVELLNNKKASLYSIFGNLLSTYELKAGKNQLEMGSLPAGIYYLQIDHQSYKITKQ